MPTWIIEPHDPIIFRDGRPFGPNPGATATSMNFPFPSTTTGGVRTRAGLDSNGVFDTRRIEEVKRIAVCGPLLVELDDKNEIIRWLVRAPADALLISPEGKEEVIRKRLVPINPGDEGFCTNLDLLPVGQVCYEPDKPTKNAPLFWYWDEMKEWLCKEDFADTVTLEDLGHNGPTSETRMHVRIEKGAQTAEEGMLFRTNGMEFTHMRQPEGATVKQFGTAKRLALAVLTEGNLHPGPAALGGERRLVQWRTSTDPWPSCPDDIINKVAHAGACRVVLLTPAYFENGYKPKWLAESRDGVTPTLCGIAVSRPQVISGWDLEKKCPKPTRRLAPAGSVFFLKLEGSEEERKAWVRSIWMHNISDTDQDQLDGFGLAVIGLWRGEPEVMKMEKEDKE